MNKRVLRIFLIILMIVTFSKVSYGATKQDIINYVNAQHVCGDSSLFNTYKSTFTRLLKQKSLTESELNTIYSYLRNAVGILNSKGVCKISDLGKLTEYERNSVYSSLSAGAGIITNAPSIDVSEGVTNTDKDSNKAEDNTNNNTDSNDGSNDNTNINAPENSSTKVTINTKDNTMDIYENGILIDKVNLSTPKMTYTGPDQSYILIYISTFSIFILSALVYYIKHKEHNAKLRAVKNVLNSLMICSFFAFTITFAFGDKLEEIKSMVSLMSFESNDDNELSVEINADKTIKRYPSYGFNYGTLEIADLNISNNIYFGDTDNILSLGIGHTTSSDMPTEGGVVIYSGHNNNRRLNNLKNIKEGMEIVVDTTYAKCTYVMKYSKILKDTEFSKLTSVDNKETLILYTCYPFDTYIYSNQRFVVYSTLKEIIWK